MELLSTIEIHSIVPYIRKRGRKPDSDEVKEAKATARKESVAAKIQKNKLT